MKFLWFCTLVASVLAGALVVVTLETAKGAPQEAAGAAIALCIAAIPYVFTRAIEGWQTANWRRDVLAQLQKTQTPAHIPANGSSPAASD